MISINEAAAQGIKYVRSPIWASELDHIKIDILEDGTAGPWTHLYSPLNPVCNKRDPVSMLFINMDYGVQAFEPYTGPLADSPEYKAAVDAYRSLDEVL